MKSWIDINQTQVSSRNEWVKVQRFQNPELKKDNNFLSSADFFQNQLFRKILSGLPLQCQTVWIQIKPDALSGLIWVETVNKGYQQTTLVEKRKMVICFNDKLTISQRSYYSMFNSVI